MSPYLFGLVSSFCSQMSFISAIYGANGMKQRNLTHKFSERFNRPMTHIDRKKEEKKNPKVRDELRHDIRVIGEITRSESGT